jgi:hypothetical protein
MNDNNILITGTPRSGTTLPCHLLNELPDTVALHEPMKVKEFSGLTDHEEICLSIGGQLSSVLLSLVEPYCSHGDRCWDDQQLHPRP